jgi:hypothetical protein
MVAIDDAFLELRFYLSPIRDTRAASSVTRFSRSVHVDLPRVLAGRVDLPLHRKHQNCARVHRARADRKGGMRVRPLGLTKDAVDAGGDRVVLSTPRPA